MGNAPEMPPVVYLAAGRGSRLGDICEVRPKAMVEVAGRALIDRAFESLRAAGFQRIVAVTGHAADQFERYEVETVFNDRWQDENNIVSLWQVRDVVSDGCVIVNCDLLFESALAQRLAATEGSAILVDDVLAVDDESMKTGVSPEGLLTRLHKSLDAADSVGEYIGMTRIDPAEGPLLSAILDEFVAAGNTQVYYEDAIEALAAERPVRIERIGGGSWIEIDDQEDLARAKLVIAPEIAMRDAENGMANSAQSAATGTAAERG